MTVTRYPAIFSKIIIALPEDGTPVPIRLRTEAEAHQQRLDWYNFLKYVRRHPRDFAHFAGKHNRITCMLKGETLTFFVRTKEQVTGLEQGFNEAIQALNLHVPAADALPIAPDMPDNDAPEIMINTEPSINPMDLLKQSLKKGEKS